METVPMFADDIPESLKLGISMLPRFKPQNDGWVEPDAEKFPDVGAQFSGTIDDEVNVSVNKLHNGLVRLTFAFLAPDEESYQGSKMCSVSWVLPSSVELDDDDGITEGLSFQFRVEGYLDVILEHELLMSVVRMTNEILDWFLVDDPRTFMTLKGSAWMKEGDELIPVTDDEQDSSMFVRFFIARMGMAQPLA